MVATDFLDDQDMRRWLGGIEPAWTLLTIDSLRALREEPSVGRTAIRTASDLSADEVAGSAVARNALILLKLAARARRSRPYSNRQPVTCCRGRNAGTL